MYLAAEDLNLNCRVFLWPKDMEAVIELAIQRLNMKRDQAESVLKQRKAQFDKRLKKTEKLLNQFKKRDPPILTMEEMEEGVTAVEALVSRLAVSEILLPLSSYTVQINPVYEYVELFDLQL